MLTELGLTAGQIALYRALLWRPQDELPAIASAAGVSAEELRGGLERLGELGMVHPTSAAPSGWRPVYPGVALRRLEHAAWDRHDQEARALRAISQEVTAFSEEFNDHRREYASTRVDEVVDPAEMTSRVSEMVREAREEILSFVTTTYQTSQLDQARRGDEELLERGIHARSIHLGSALEAPHMNDYLRWMEGRGAFVRTAPSLPVRMIIFDRAAAVVSRHPLNPDHGALIVQSTGLISALVGLFEAYWDRGSALPLVDGTTEMLSAMEKDILALLGVGMKDEAIAHKLEVSVRTVRRALTQLYERTASESRFELGAKAARLGWL